MTKSKVDVTSNFLKQPTAAQKENFASKRNNTKTPLISSIIILLIFVAIVAGIFLTGFFNVKDYKVSGNTQVATKDIEDYVGSLVEGKLILSINPVNIETQLLNKFTLLSFARVKKDLPNTLTVEVKERSKSIVIKTLENTVLVSQDGSILEELEDKQITNNMYQDINVVKLIDEPKRSKGYLFDPAFISGLSGMVNAWKNYKSSSNPTYKSPTFADVVVDKDKNVKFILENGGTALLSLSDSNVNVVELVSDLISAYNKLSVSKKIKNIDIRFDNKIAVTYF